MLLEQARRDHDALGSLIARATTDMAFRLRLKAEPVAVLREAGVEVPDGCEVRVREVDPNCRYLFLPPFVGSLLTLAQSPSGAK